MGVDSPVPALRGTSYLPPLAWHGSTKRRCCFQEGRTLAFSPCTYEVVPWASRTEYGFMQESPGPFPTPREERAEAAMDGVNLYLD